MDDMDRFAISTATAQKIEEVTISMPKKMSPQSWQMLLDTLELWKKQASEA